jgi:hypothetical protein
MNYQIVGVLIISYFATKSVISPSSKKKGEKTSFLAPFQFSTFNLYTYSCQLLIFNPSTPTAQNASMNAVW